MSRIFITGSSDGLGQLAAEQLIAQGHQVVLHARNAARAKQARDKVPAAEQVLTGDLSSIEETKKLAAAVNAMGHFDAVIHNAGVYHVSAERTVDGLPVIFAVNSLAPYILTCLIHRPRRLVYLSSGMHLQGDADLKDITADQLRKNSSPSYSDSKAQVLLLSNAVSRLWPEVYSNAVDPGWVPTKMGGSAAPDDLTKGAETQAWLAASLEPSALVSGCYFYHKKIRPFLPETAKMEVQNKYLNVCQQICGISFPQE